MCTPGPCFCSVLLGVFLLLSSQLQVSGRPGEFFIKPTLSEDCGNKQPCWTLSDYIQNINFYFTSHRTFYFLPGNHTVQSNKATSVVIHNVINLTLTAKQQASVVCEGNLSFSFINISNLKISNLEFVGCGLEKDDINEVQAAIKLDNISTVLLRNLHIRDSFGYGVFGFNVLGQSKVTGCRFYHNQWRPPADESEVNHQRHARRSKTNKMLGGNALFIFDEKLQIFTKNVALVISHSDFAYGIHTSEWYKNMGYGHIGGGSGLGIFYQEPYRDVRFYLESYRNMKIVISDCTFFNNTAFIGANLFLDWGTSIPYQANVRLDIIHCKFHNGKAYLKGGGMYIHTHSSKEATKIKVQIIYCFFESNFGKQGGGLFLDSKHSPGSRGRNDHSVILMNCLFKQNSASNGGGIYAAVKSLKTHYGPSRNDGTIKVIISNTKFIQNSAIESGGSLHLYVERANILTFQPQVKTVTSISLVTHNLISIEVNNCNITESEAALGSALIISGCENEYHFILEKYECSKPLNTSIQLSHVNFLNNTSPQIDYGTAVLHVNNTDWIILKDSLFDTNNGSGVYVNASNVILRGLVQFFNNKAYYGGAIHLDCNVFSKQSLLYLTSGKLLITNNTVKIYGGAIAANEQCIDMDLCFFQELLPTSRQSMVVIMKNNTAEVAGDSIYGGLIESCHFLLMNSKSELSIREQLTADYFARIFKTDGLPSSSNIASRAYKVCFCNESSSLQLQECITTKEMSVFKGQEFNILAATVGQYRGASPAIVRSKLQTFGFEGQLGAQQGVQGLGRACENLTYSIRATADYVELHLTVEGALTSSLAIATINVTFLPCPFGFQPSGIPQKCDCAQELTGIPGVWCDIDTITVHRPAAMWIGNNSNSHISHSNCPFDYCKPEDSNLSLWNQDDQCVFNRSGVLCGACQPGLSLALGTSQCLQCSNIYLLLLIPFALAGVTLVFLLLKCNLTVSEGTINGLIFYANIVRVNQAIFFPQSSSLFVTKILSVFIAWLNLDLGVQICFFTNMTAYTKACFQFLFPIYIWLLVGVMIVSSQYSSTISKLTGSNAVPVLATLFLLSYAKLLRAIIEAASPIVLTDKNSLVWLMDGNVAFLKGAHIFLFLFALVAMVLYIVPLTLLALLAPCLQARSRQRLLRWVNKLKPLLDAYQGPYKDGFRYWTGLMLVVRIILFTVFASNVVYDMRMNLLAIITMLYAIVICFWNFGRVYKTIFVHMLEIFFILNLIVFAACTQFLKTSKASSQKLEYVTCTMVGSAFIVFWGIITYHSYHQIRNSRVVFVQYIITLCCRQRKIPKTPPNRHDPNEDVIHVSPQPTVTVVELCQLTES